MNSLPILKTALILFVFLFLSNQAEAQEFITKQGYVEFTSKAPLTTFKGKSDKLAGLVDLNKNMIDFYVDLATIDTGIDMRNKHMRNRYLETEKYPFAEFTGELISEVDPARSDTQHVQVKGEFTIHGISRERTIDGKIYINGDKLYLEASFNVLLKDHDIDRPKVVFYELAEDQDVYIEGVLEKQE